MYASLVFGTAISAVIVATQVAARRYEQAHSASMTLPQTSIYYEEARQRIAMRNLVFQLLFALTCFAYVGYVFGMLNMTSWHDQALAGVSLFLPLTVALWDPKSWANGLPSTDRNYRNFTFWLTVVCMLLCELHAFGAIDLLALMGLKAA